MTEYEKIKIIRKALKKNQEEFAGGFGIQQNTYSSYETGAKDLPKHFIRILKAEYNINPEWWEDGKEPIFLPKEIKNIDKSISEDVTEIQLLKKIINNLEDEVQFYRYLLTENNKMSFNKKADVSPGEKEIKQHG